MIVIILQSYCSFDLTISQNGPADLFCEKCNVEFDFFGTEILKSCKLQEIYEVHAQVK